MVNFNPILFVVVGIACTSIAQILLKIGSSFNIMSGKWMLFLLISLFTYAVSFLCYYLALKFYDITKISPVMMVCTVSIVALYGFLIGENMNALRLIGIVLAIISIIFISQS
jgi:drug/metabolite transporter (DMT)-like permease